MDRELNLLIISIREQFKLLVGGKIGGMVCVETVLPPVVVVVVITTSSFSVIGRPGITNWSAAAAVTAVTVVLLVSFAATSARVLETASCRP